MTQSTIYPKIKSKNRIYTLYIYLFLFAVFSFTQPFDLLYSDHYADKEITADMKMDAGIERNLSGSLTRRLALLSLCAFAMVSLLQKTRERFQINGHLGWLIIFFIIWAFTSLAWAGDGLFLAVRRVIILGILSLGALAIAERFSLKDLIGFAFFSGILTLGLGFFCELILGTFHPFETTYRFCGQMQPLYQSINCGMMCIAALVLARTTKRGRFFYLAAVPVGIFFMLITKSRAPTAFFLIAVLTYWVLVLSIYRKVAYINIAIIVSLIVIFALDDSLSTYAQKITTLGREEMTMTSLTNLTGRIPLWKECIDYAAQRPFLGYGYDSFYTPYHTNKIYFATGWATNDTHNAYIDVLLGLGIPGVFAFSLILIISFKRSFRYYKTTKNIGWAFVCAILIMYLLNNLLLAQHLHPNIPTFVALVIFAKLGFCNSLTEKKYPKIA